MDNCNTNPISSNQVIEVGLRKPKCFEFEGNTLNDWLKEISEKLCCQEETLDSVQDIVVGTGWTIVRQPKLLKKGKLYHLSGELSGGDVQSVIATLPVKITERRIVPLAHEFTGTTYNVFLKIEVDRNLRLYFTGTAPTGESSKLYLDGISFFVE